MKGTRAPDDPVGSIGRRVEVLKHHAHHLRQRHSRHESPSASGSGGSSAAMDENLKAIKAWEEAVAASRSATERLGDWLTRAAASGPVMLGHVIWFVGWIVVNLGFVAGLAPFDPYPFQFLTLTVSLEAIFLALFVLASQNSLARQADKRSHLDLQIDLLAEREMSAVLELLCGIAGKLDVHTELSPDQMHDLARKTDLEKLTSRLDESPDAGR